MNRNLLWRLFSAFLYLAAFKYSQAQAEGPTQGSDLKKVAIEFDLLGDDALLTYNDSWRSKAKISYAQKKKIVAYKDEKNSRCLLEKIRRHDQARDGDLKYVRVYRIIDSPIQKDKVEKLAGKRIAAFCEKYPPVLLKEIDEQDTVRVKRQTDYDLRGSESPQEISKRLLDDFMQSESVTNGEIYNGKGIKRDVDTGRGQYPSASSKVGQPAGVDYHARIRNNLHPAAHNVHPIDITSSVTITTGSSHPMWSYSPSAGSHFGSSNGTLGGHAVGGTGMGYSSNDFSHLPPSASSAHQNASLYPSNRVSAHGPKHQQGLHPSGLRATHPAGYNQGGQIAGGGVHNATHGQGIGSQAGQYGPSASSRGLYPQQYQPSSQFGHQPLTGGNLYHFPQNNTHPNQQGVYAPGRLNAVYAPQFAPSSSGKLYPQSNVRYGTPYGGYGDDSVGHDAPASSTRPHHLSNVGHAGSLDQTGGVHQYYSPSSGGKAYGGYGGQYGGLQPQFPPSSTSKTQYPSGSGGRDPGLLAGKGSDGGVYPPSSTSKQLYYPQGQRPSGAGYPGSYYMPSSTSKMHYPPSSIHQDGGVGAYPPSSSSRMNFGPGHGQLMPHGLDHQQGVHYTSTTPRPHYPPSATHGGMAHGESGQMPHTPVDRQGLYSPSASSKMHYPSYQSGGRHDGSHGQAEAHQVYYAPSSGGKLHQGSTNYSSQYPGRSSSGYYPPSSESKIHQNNRQYDSSQMGGHVTVTERVSITPAGYYPPSSSSKAHYGQQGLGQQQPGSYYGPSSTSYMTSNGTGAYHGGGLTHGQEMYSAYPPSSHGKMPSHQTGISNGTGGHHLQNAGNRNLHVSQFPSSPGSQHYGGRLNDSSVQSGYGGHLGRYHPGQGGQTGGGYYSGYAPQYPPSSSSFSLNNVGQRNGQGVRPCQGSPRSHYSITTRTILTPNGVIHRPISVKSNGESPCGDFSRAATAVQGHPQNTRPCTSVRNGVRTPCTNNRLNRQATRKTQRSVIVPGPAMIPQKRIPVPQFGLAHTDESVDPIRPQFNEMFNNEGVVITNVGESQAELLDGIDYQGVQFSKLQTKNDTLSKKTTDDTSALEFDKEKDVEVFEDKEEAYEHPARGRPMKYEEEESKEEEAEEEVKEGDILEPGDRILGKNGYTISDGFRGRVVSVTGQIAKKRAETGKDNKTSKASNVGHFRYSSELGRYVKEEEKSYSNCEGELTFTCTEFLGSNGRAKICKPNPRRRQDGSPC